MKKTIKLLGILTSIALSFIGGRVVYALTSAPNFLTCQSLYGTNGDVASYDSGVHQIVGGGLVEGSDDVYSQSNGNYLQCYCPAIGSDGIQTNWWLADTLSQEDIDYYKSMGWFYENGLVWNLGDHMYLAKNMDSICTLPSPTPTPIITVTPTPTISITPTPTPDNSPRCDGLSVSPSEGTAPLTVRFNANGYDPNGPVLEYEFDYGDSSGGQPQVWKTKDSESPHRYENPGKYVATVKIKDQGGQWRGGNDNCTKYITVYEKPKVLGTGTPKGLPETGVGDIFGLFPFVTLPLGIYLTKKFRVE